ncbi:unnamed protein product [Brassica oleracea var. botrytis]|uniref:(rape) hypothetical protein n=1 Tax=Brassica napus TaxID=3708 RepID=A0A816KDJ3_BRANA|nr:unnamed protein product [Brassica napus]
MTTWFDISAKGKFPRRLCFFFFEHTRRLWLWTLISCIF